MTTKSPDLEVVSRSSEKKDYTERRRMPRLGLTAEQFRLSRNGKLFPVTDLSPTGMAVRVLDRGDIVSFTVGSHIEGMLNLRGQKYAIKAQVKNLRADLVGCEFENLSAPVSQALHWYLDPAVLGRELKPVPSTEPGTIWYHGPSGTDLIFTRSMDGEYRRMTLYVLGSYIQWDREAGLSTGLAEAGGDNGEAYGLLRFETMLLKADAAPDASKLEIAKTLLIGSNLSQDLKKWCMRQLAPA